MNQYEVGQKVRTLYGEIATILAVRESGESVFYFCHVRGQLDQWIHGANLFSI
jgi:hypothetical protein